MLEVFAKVSLLLMVLELSLFLSLSQSPLAACSNSSPLTLQWPLFSWAAEGLCKIAQFSVKCPGQALVDTSLLPAHLPSLIVVLLLDSSDKLPQMK